MQENRWIDIFHPTGAVPEDTLVEIQWFNTNWCNNKCPYCMQNHKREEAHSFDFKPPLEWAKSFNAIKVPYYLYITGGESLLDIKAFTEFYNAVIESPFLREVRIDTNCTMPAKQLAGLHVAKTILMTSYHPSALTLDETAAQIKSYQELGFRISMVNYVCRPEQIPEFIDIREQFEAHGLSATSGIYFGGDVKYDSLAVRSYERVIDKLDIGMKTAIIDPFELPCGAGAHYLMLDPKGQIKNCWGEWDDFFAESFSIRTGFRPCPEHRCVCIDAYSMLKMTGRTPGVSLEDYIATYSSAVKTRVVLVCGYFGAGNFGDELLLDALLEKLKKIPGVLPIILGVGKNSGIVQRHGLPFYLLNHTNIEATAKLVSLCDAVLVGPGGLLQEFSGEPQEFYSGNGSHHYLHPAVLAQLSEKPCYAVGLGCDSTLTASSRAGYALAMKGMNAVLVRDEESLSNVQAFGLQNARLSTDFAFAYPVAPMMRPLTGKKVIGVNLRGYPNRDSNHLMSAMAGAMCLMMEKGWQVRLLLLDLIDEKRIKEVFLEFFEKHPQYKASFEVVEPEGVEAAIEEIQKLDAFLCMRLHGSLLAARMGVPFLALSYLEKVSAMIERIDMSDCIVDPYVLEAKDFFSKAEWLLKNRESLIKRQLEGCKKQEEGLEESWQELLHEMSSSW